MLLTIDMNEEARRLERKMLNAASHVRVYAIESAEKRIDAQVQIMLAADARAMSMSRMGISLATVALTAAVAAFSSQLKPLVVALLLSAICAFLGAVCCYRSAAPVDVLPNGWKPSDFEDDLLLAEERFQASVAGWLGCRIRQNDRTMAENSNRFKLGTWMIFVSPILGALLAISLLYSAS